MSIATAEPETAPSVYACTQPRTTWPLARIHTGEDYQPRDLRTAVRWVLNTKPHKLMLALAYLNGHAQHPVTVTTSKDGFRTIGDGYRGRVFEIAAAIHMIEAAGLDPNVVIALRGAYISHDDAFAILASGTGTRTARDYWFDPNTIPDERTLLTMGAMRGVDVSPTDYDD